MLTLSKFQEPLKVILTDSLFYDDVRNTKLIGVKVYVFKCGNNHKGRLLCPT